MSSETQSALNASILKLLRPLCRLLLRNGVGFAAFEELAKSVYVQTAMRDMAIPGKKATVSRASVLTGLTRKDVQRLHQQPEGGSVADEQYNRAARVLTAWVRDPDFQSPDGEPALLHLNDGEASFAALVRRHSGDMPARAVLDELLRVGAVRREPDGRLALLTRAFVPAADESAKLTILGNDVADLVTTIDHNILRGVQDPRFQRKVMYRNYPASQVQAFRQLSAQKAQALLESMDQWLSDHADDSEPSEPMRLGLGIYYFEEPMANAVAQGNTE